MKTIEQLIQNETNSSFIFLRSKLPHKNAEFIEDVFCDARLKAIKHFDKFDSTLSFKPWWNKILLNSLKDRISNSREYIPLDLVSETVEDKRFDLFQSLKVSEIISILENMDYPLSINLNRPMSNSERQKLYKLRKKISKACNVV